MPEKVSDIGWTEEARAAALEARLHTKPVPLNALQKVGVFFSQKGWPYKVVNYNPENKNYDILTSKRTFAEAYNSSLGTHVIQTHGTAAEVEQQVRGTSRPSPSEGAALGRRAATGFILGGPMGAALGAATSSRLGGEKMYQLPTPIITSKVREPVITVAPPLPHLNAPRPTVSPAGPDTDPDAEAKIAAMYGRDP